MYTPGDVVPEGITVGDLAYLKRKGFVELVDAVFPAGDISDQEPDSIQDESNPEQEEDDDDGVGLHFPDIDGLDPEDMKSPEEIQKMRTKDEVYAYAQSIGLDLGDDYKEKALKELQESVITYQEQMEVTS